MIRFVALVAALALPFYAQATGRMTCEPVDRSEWLTEADLTEMLKAEGWDIRFMKEDGGCWEVYGTTPDGLRVEAYFHPSTGEKLLVAQRGRILYRVGTD